MIISDPSVTFTLDSWPVEILRGICIVSGFIDLVLLVPVGKRQRRSIYHETTMFCILGLVTVSIVFTEIGRIGHIITWRLPINTVAMVLLALWLLGYLRLPISYVTRKKSEPDPPFLGKKEETE